MSEISKEYLEKELEHMNSELQKANTFIVQVQTGISLYKTLLLKIEEVDQVSTPEDLGETK